MKILFLVSLLLGVTLQVSYMNRVVLSAKGQALCLDGSPGAYYISEGNGVNKTKFILYFQGGGWCGSTSLANTLESCYQRSNTDLGSSKNYPPNMNVTNSGFLSGDEEHNPGFHDWTKVYLKYCDGSGHQGTRSLPLNYKNKDLYFRGQNVTIGQLDAVDATYKLWTEGTEIIVSGCSAGGLAAFIWTNYIAGKAKGKVYSVPDSGIFLDAANIRNGQNIYRNELANLMAIANVETGVPVPQCHRDYPNENWRCLLAQYLHNYITVPLFPVESLYDSWSAPNIIGVSCIDQGSLLHCNQTDRDALQVYQKSTAKILSDITSRDGNGAWAPACSGHCYIHYSAWTNKNNYAIPAGSMFTTQQAISRWYLKVQSPENHIHQDTQPWPSNRGCSGAVSFEKFLLTKNE